MSKSEEQHYRSLDGLRGVAALSVVCLHYVSAFLPFLIGWAATQRHTSIDHLVATTPFQLPIAGNFAVCIFFVLSGFVLSLKFFSTKDVEALVSSAARRLFRLLIPALGSIVLAYIVLRIGGIFLQTTGAITGSSWAQLFWHFPAHLGQAIFQGVYGIWFGTFNLHTSYNPVLWTMHYELYGSFLVFMAMALFGKGRNRWIFYSALGIIFLKTYYLAFVAGMVISDLVVNHPGFRDKINPRIFWFALPLSIVLGTWTTTVETIYPTVYNHLSLPFFTRIQLEIFAHIIGAIIVIMAVLCLKPFSELLMKKPIQYLGKVSFSLYLTHFIVLGSVSSFLFNRIEPSVGYKLALLVTIPVGFAVSFVVASLYTRWVDVRSIALSKRVGNYLQTGNVLGDLVLLRKHLAASFRRSAQRKPELPPEPVADTELSS